MQKWYACRYRWWEKTYSSFLLKSSDQIEDEDTGLDRSLDVIHPGSYVLESLAEFHQTPVFFTVSLTVLNPLAFRLKDLVSHTTVGILNRTIVSCSHPCDANVKRPFVLLLNY